MYIPEWIAISMTRNSHIQEEAMTLDDPCCDILDFNYWEIDDFYPEENGGEWNRIGENVKAGFQKSVWAFDQVVKRYKASTIEWAGCTLSPPQSNHRSLERSEAVHEAQHAMVMAHIVSRRTDDPKIGVGAVLVQDDLPSPFHPNGETKPMNPWRYISIGWNGFPRRSQRHDFPRLGADEARDSREELKYAYVLHAEQNALLFRTANASFSDGSSPRFYSTKYPCDECAPLIADAGISCVFSIPPSNNAIAMINKDGFQNDSITSGSSTNSVYRGLTYTKLKRLVPSIWLFRVNINPSQSPSKSTVSMCHSKVNL
jgi:deoxycytidylate deaminase